MCVCQRARHLSKHSAHLWQTASRLVSNTDVRQKWFFTWKRCAKKTDWRWPHGTEPRKNVNKRRCVQHSALQSRLFTPLAFWVKNSSNVQPVIMSCVYKPAHLKGQFINLRAALIIGPDLVGTSQFLIFSALWIIWTQQLMTCVKRHCYSRLLIWKTPGWLPLLPVLSSSLCDSPSLYLA